MNATIGSMVQFEHPDPLLLAALVAGLCVICVVVSLRRTRTALLSKFLYATSLMLCLATLVLIVGQPFILNWSGVSKALFLIDVSDSMPEASAEELFQKAKTIAATFDSIELIPFAGQIGPKPYTDFPSSYRSLKANANELDIGNTDLAHAFQGQGLVAADKVVLLSDGWETKGDILALLKERPSEYKIFPLVASQEQNRDAPISILQIDAPQMQASGSKAAVRVVIDHETNYQAPLKVELKRGETVLSSHDYRPGTGASKRFSLETDELQEGPQELTIELKNAQGGKELISESVFISGTPREKVLLLSSSSEEARILERALRNQNFQLDSEIAQEKFKAQSPHFSNYDTVVFNNVPRTDFASDMPRELKSYVEGGGTFVMIGGNKSFGLGGYQDSAIEGILPVRILPPQKKTKRLNVAVVLLLDKSGSMRSEQKLDFAKLAAREVIGSLKDADYIGIIGVDDAPFITQQIGQLGSVRSEANRKVGLLYSVGGTNFLPAIDIAKRHLDKVDAGRKHVVMLTDGKLPDGFSMRPYYLQLVEDMRLSGITLSTFLIGGESGDLLTEMANKGGGAFHRTRNAQTLPRLFLDDIRISTGEKTQREASQFHVSKAAPHSIVSTTLSEFPDLLGYTETQEKSVAQTELLVRDNRKADPLLASWNVQNGRVIAFTSDASGRWSKLWVGWNRYVAFWTDLIAPKKKDQGDNLKNTPLDLRYEYNKGILSLKLSVFADSVIPTPSGTLKLPDGNERSVVWQEIAPGYYEAQFEEVMAGGFQLATKVNEIDLTTLGFRLSGTLFGERQGHGFNKLLLHQLATRSGGSTNPSPDTLAASKT
ncbi:MAG: VWA domain-containing protein, partial [Bdellovibrionales bacterium]|nr:VWA domain-containing protein [Bdellovibrionales bacterium]